MTGIYGICEGGMNEKLLEIDFLTELLVEHTMRNISDVERFCPCCGTHFERPFVKFGGREDSSCPVCHSKERHRALCVLLPQLLIQRAKALMFAAYKTKDAIANYAGRHVHLTTTDLYEEGADVRADIQSLPFANNSFDLILNSHVMEHVTDDIRAFREQYRVLKGRGSLAVFQAPINFNRERTFERNEVSPAEAAKWQVDHVRDYGADFLDRAQSVGFDCTVITLRDALAHLPEPAFQRFTHFISSKAEHIVFCRKCKQ